MLRKLPFEKWYDTTELETNCCVGNDLILTSYVII